MCMQNEQKLERGEFWFSLSDWRYGTICVSIGFQWRSHTFAMNVPLCAVAYVKRAWRQNLNFTTLYHSYAQVCIVWQCVITVDCMYQSVPCLLLFFLLSVSVAWKNPATHAHMWYTCPLFTSVQEYPTLPVFIGYICKIHYSILSYVELTMHAYSAICRHISGVKDNSSSVHASCTG